MQRAFVIALALAVLLAASASVAQDAAEPALAFTRGGDLWVAAADGSGARRLLVNAYGADWSPDGRRLAFVRRAGSIESIWVADADGGNLRRLTRGGRHLEPEWSPDGRRIAFSAAGEIWTMRADGSQRRPLVRRQQRWHEHHSPTWARSGIVYSSNRAGFFNPELYAVPARRLTFTRGSDGVLGDDGMPTFSPGGRRIAFTSNRTQRSEIWLMNADGSAQRQLTRRGRDSFLPAWSADGRTIAFAAIDSGWIMRIDDRGRGLRRLVRGTDPAFRPT
jgi:Tol biopolymer transport system component